MTTVNSQRTGLYRVFGARRALLYIGMSNNPTRRMRDHAGKQPWAPLISHYEVEWHPSRSEAHAAEIAAIKTERPAWNQASSMLGPLRLDTLRPEDLIRTAHEIHLEVLAEMKALYGVTPQVRAS